MSSLDLVKSIYKPYRYTLNKSVTIIESTSGKFIIKKQNKDLYSLFSYLDSRGFYYHPKLVNNYRNEDNIFEYIEEDKVPPEQKLEDLSMLLASLHNKTVYYKTTTLDDYKEIYDDIDNNIRYLNNYYESLFLNICKEEYLSPSKYLFTRNYYKIREAFNFCQDELDSWYELVKDHQKERVAVVHNNLALDHFIDNHERQALISWDNYKVDTPIMDFVNLYHNSYLDYDFSEFFNKYTNNFTLLDNEQKLLFILISLPLYIVFEDNEFKNTQKVHNFITYTFKTEQLVRPYYAKQKEE